MELPSLIHSSLGHQEMKVGVKVDPGAEGLNGGDDPGMSLLEIAREGRRVRSWVANAAGSRSLCSRRRRRAVMWKGFWDF